MKKSCLIIAGEKSGEEHALSFYQKLLDNDPELEFFGVGGDQLSQKGMDLIYHLNDFSSWGVSEVITKIPFYFKALKKVEDEVEIRNCKYAILIDFQSFNHRLAKRLKKKGVKVFYYVAPQAWAWKAYRAKSLGEYVHTLFTIIPFERNWFLKRGVKRVESVPHPLLVNYKDKIKSYKRERGFKDLNKKLRLLLLPGSRNFEVKLLLGEFMKTARELRKEYSLEVSIVCSKSVSSNLYEPYLKEIDLIFDNEKLDEALKYNDLGLAASGTVTLACALFELPTIVAYQTSLLNEFIFKSFINYDGFISLCNIVHQKEVFKELIGEHANAFNFIHALKLIIDNESCYDLIRSDLLKTVPLIEGETFDVAKYIVGVIKDDEIFDN